MNFLTILLAITILEAYGQLGFIQRDGWVAEWHQRLTKLSFLSAYSSLRLAFFILIPAVVVHVLASALSQNQFGFFVFVLELVVLLYALGRGNLDTQIALLNSDLEQDALQKAFNDASLVNTTNREGEATSSEDPRNKAFAALPYRAFERSFAVIFWFFFFGAPAALVYRLLALHGDLDLQDRQNVALGSDKQISATRLLWLLEWIPARLLGFTLGLVGSFSHSMAHLWELIFSGQTATAELLRRCVHGALGDINSNEPKSVAVTKAAIDAITSLFRRAMTAWLVGIAILVILT